MRLFLTRWILGLTLLAVLGAACRPAAPPAAGPTGAPMPTTPLSAPAANTPVTPTASPAAGAGAGDPATVTPILAASPTVQVRTAPSPASAVSPAPSPASAGSPFVRPSPSPVVPESDLPLAIDPTGLWSIRHPIGLSRESLSNAVTVFISSDRSTFVAVDSYIAAGNEYGNTGEGLRNRARDTLALIYGRPVTQQTVLEREELGRWEQGLTFTTDLGSAGQAVYGQPGRDQGDFRVYGVLFGSQPTAAAANPEQLTAAKDSFLPLLALPVPGASSRTAATAFYSYGMRSFEPSGSEHFIAVYRQEGPRWQEIARQSLDCPDYLGPGSVTVVPLEPARAWLQAEGGAGAHAGCYDLLSFDGRQLQLWVEHSHASPDAGFTRDLLSDGRLEVILNQGDPYVFCYACGVRLIAYRVIRWNGSAFEEVILTRAPSTLPADLRTTVDRAVALAEAGLWKSAQETIDRAVTRDPRAEPVQWNAALIHLTAAAAADATRQTGYPLLQNVFFGDYPAAIAEMRPYTPAQIFGPNSPLIQGTVAEGWADSLVDHLMGATSAALAVQPDLAEAHFLRGWAISLKSPGSPDALREVEEAARLNPNDPLFQASAGYLRGSVANNR